MPLKVYVDTGESVWSTNGVEFDSYQAAKSYGEGLQWRWTAVRAFAVVPVTPGFYGYLTTKAVREIVVRE